MKKTTCEHLIDMLSDEQCRGEMTGHQKAALEDVIQLLELCTVEQLRELKSELATAKEAICQMCRARGEEQHILCGCATCKYGGGKNGE